MGAKGSGGHNAKLSKAVQDTICQTIRAGGYLFYAVEESGISYSTYQSWMARGRAFEENGGPKADRKYYDFAVAVRRARARDALRSQSVITRAELAGDWKAAAWSLEKKHPDTYGERGQGGPVITVRGGVATPGSGGALDDSGPRIEFYLPDNGRRPDSPSHTNGSNGSGGKS